MKWLKNNVGVVLIIVAIIGFVLFNSLSNFNQVTSIDNDFPTQESENDESIIKVEIKGEVLRPGIYDLNLGDRVVDLINKAGGLTINADTDSINQSQRLVDELVVSISSKSDYNLPPDDIFRYIQVEIKGEVVLPGVYRMKENAIIYDLIIEAGGLSSLADTSNINLAEKLIDKMTYLVKKKDDSSIYVELKGEVKQPGVYEMNQGDLLINVIDKAGGFTDSAYIDELNLADKLKNNQVIYVVHINDVIKEKAIEIKGEVKQPGVYYFYDETRIIDVIQMAGGLTELANYEKINLSEIVNDEQLLIIPKVEDEKMIAVDLKGEVKYPGVYYLLEGSRTIDLIRLAGGFRPDADSGSINLSEILEDQDIILVNKHEDLNKYYYIEITGEIMLPGIYSILPGERLIMLVNRAGGFASNAYTDDLNLTRELIDEEKIVIPSKADEKIYVVITGEVFNPGTYNVSKGITIRDMIDIAGGLTVNADIQKIDFYKQLNIDQAIHIVSVEEDIPDIPNDPSGKIDINTANSEALQTLNGIGIILAERIIEYRISNGGFQNIEEIMNVSGIGTSIYEKIKDDITV